MTLSASRPSHPSHPSPVLRAVTGALATYRLTKLVNEDKLTEDLRQRVVDHFGELNDSKVSYLVHCPWCVSIYAGAAVAFVDTMFPNSRVAKAALAALAFSAVTGIMAERENSF